MSLVTIKIKDIRYTSQSANMDMSMYMSFNHIKS